MANSHRDHVRATPNVTWLEMNGEVIARCATCDYTTFFPRGGIWAGCIVRCLGCGGTATYQGDA